MPTDVGTVIEHRTYVSAPEVPRRRAPFAFPYRSGWLECRARSRGARQILRRRRANLGRPCARGSDHRFRYFRLEILRPLTAEVNCTIPLWKAYEATR